MLRGGKAALADDERVAQVLGLAAAGASFGVGVGPAEGQLADAVAQLERGAQLLRGRGGHEARRAGVDGGEHAVQRGAHGVHAAAERGAQGVGVVRDELLERLGALLRRVGVGLAQPAQQRG